jgi:hypothetical protein
LADARVDAPKRKGSRRWKLIAFLVLIVLPVGGFSAYTWITLHISFSSGERVGYVQKLSHRGWVCKTWEGELAMVNMPGAASEIFDFTVPNDAVARGIMDAAGKRVALSYEQHRGVPSKCFGETEYFVTAVRVLGQ